MIRVTRMRKKKRNRHNVIVPVEKHIRTLRGVRVLLDSDLASVYGVSTARLNQQVKRNAVRFPDDFVFQVTQKEYDALMLQTATSNDGRGGRRKLPYAFTEHGAIMAANVLRSRKALETSVYVVRAFVRLRETAVLHRDLAEKLKELEQRVNSHDSDIGAIVRALRELMAPEEKPKRQIGFRVEEPTAMYRATRRKK